MARSPQSYDIINFSLIDHYEKEIDKAMSMHFGIFPVMTGYSWHMPSDLNGSNLRELIRRYKEVGWLVREQRNDDVPEGRSWRSLDFKVR